jgi:branched-subunit amino acid ABC-type transport system permease component
MSAFVESIGFGLVTASILAISGVGFTMQFGVTSVFNLAYASIMGLAAFVAYDINAAGANIWLGAVGGVAAGALVSAAASRLIVRPFARRKQSAWGTALVTLGLGIVLEYSMVLVWGNNIYSYAVPREQAIDILGTQLTMAEIAIIVIAIVALVLVHLVLRYTRLGKAMRAAAVNPPLARSSGIRVSLIVDVAWLISGALCGLGGVVLALDLGSFTPYTTNDFLIVIIAAAVLGGIGQPYGAMLGALVVGLATELEPLVWNPAYKQVVAFVILVIVLLIRPRGLLSGVFAQRDAVV